ncbi:hypothetical protein KSF_108590 [Reticulibacter mediterranei]|uniref:Protein kinase domain-containing protein n=1 Tax=Reticulibacter mediterranei TaxID=2778369 RepID=A0A8J3IU07_9CHLR|nr:protein kinase [Reticulibacter mediterranei]GHP00812.1 hypothetical protein KSF_108590 [Reticulibacter mediterranei]
MEYRGRQLGSYYLDHLLGRGHFATVYLGYHTYLQMAAAVKILSECSGTSDTFLTEAQTVAKLHHRHIIRVFDFGVDETTQAPYFVMEYAPYGSLRQLHPRGSILPLPAIVSYAKQIASALYYAHEAKLVHRDVKPENILLGKENELLLSDFGIAALAHSTASLHTLDPVGTPVYMAPEMFEGKPRPASDQYALAVMVYEWLCGAPPFQGDVLQLLHQHVHTPLPSLQEKGIDPAIERVVSQALAKDPHARFEHIQAFVNVLEQVCLPHPVSLQSTLPVSSSSTPLVASRDASRKHQEPQRYTILDLGTTVVRAVLVEVSGEEQVEILGYGSCEQQRGAMDAGRICNIPSVIETSNNALLLAEKHAGGAIAPQASIGVSHPAIQCVSLPVASKRRYPGKLITAEEFDVLLSTTLSKAHEQALERFDRATRVALGELYVMHLAALDVRVDGQQVSNPLGFCGQYVTFTLTATFAPRLALGAIESVAQGLDLTLRSISAPIHAVASYLFRYEEDEHEALLIDVGGGTTQLAWTQAGVITKLSCIPFGGKRITQQLARQEGIDMLRAEEQKRAAHHSPRLLACIQKAYQQWLEQIARCLLNMAGEGTLPPEIHIFGGSANQPEFCTLLQEPSWKEHLPFSRPPMVHFIDPTKKHLVSDPKRSLLHRQDFVLLASAYSAISFEQENFLSRALDRAIQRLSL